MMKENPLKMPKAEEVKITDFGISKLQVVQITKDNRDYLTSVVLSRYADKPCRICGKNVSMEDLKTAVWARYSSDNESCTAHAECWDKDIPESEWVKQ